MGKGLMNSKCEQQFNRLEEVNTWAKAAGYQLWSYQVDVKEEFGKEQQL